MTILGLVTSPACLEHDPGAGHPERAQRLTALLARLDSSGLMQECVQHSAGAAAHEALLRIHPESYRARVEERIAAGADWVDSPDANVGRASYAAALRATGGALDAVDRVASGEWQRAFVAVRPPGHHAEENLAMGFCLFNSVAIAARQLQAVHGLARIAIVDWDVHHGNGTQHLFEEDGSVLYASLHQFPHYPGTGAEREVGRGDGAGTTLNCPLAAGTGDSEWLTAFEERVLPALEDYKPDALLISAGFDAHERDPLSDTLLSTEAFAHMTRTLVEFADSTCSGRLVSVLEGGYDLEGLSLSAEVHVRALLA